MNRAKIGAALAAALRAAGNADGPADDTLDYLFAYLDPSMSADDVKTGVLAYFPELEGAELDPVVSAAVVSQAAAPVGVASSPGVGTGRPVVSSPS